MVFCECGAILSTRGNNTFECFSCKRRITLDNNKSDFKLSFSKKDKGDLTVIIDEPVSGGALVNRNCPNSCGSKEAIQFVKPPMYGDEDELELYKCTKCGCVYREASRLT